MSDATGVPIPANYPVVGRDAYRTATGVHAAAVIKAYKKKDPELADAVYSGVPASLVGREQAIEVGPMSGRSNVVYWLERRGIEATDERVDRIFAKAKAASGVLTETEIREADLTSRPVRLFPHGSALLNCRQRRQEHVSHDLQAARGDLVEVVAAGRFVVPLRDSRGR